ncbi:MAG: hypothetical protein AABX51_06660, partial [Nanoarchaeota archaeon]
YDILRLADFSTSYTAANLYAACASGSVYINDDATLGPLADGASISFTLGAQANTDLANQLSSGYFGICIKDAVEGAGLTWYSDIRSHETASSSDRPRLTVDYTPPSATLNVSLVYPTTNVNVSYGRFFNFTVNVSCSGASCGNVNVSLDPEAVGLGSGIVEEKTFFQRLWSAFKSVSNFMTGFAVGNLVSTTTGATPFYTNMSNPLNSTHFSCLNNMAAGSSCIVYWYVNATNQSGTYEFWAFANSSTGLNAQSGRVNISINWTDTISPSINLIAPADATSSTTSEYNFTFNISDQSSVNCSLVLDGAVVGNLTSVAKNVNVGIYYAGISIADHTWSINCTDSANNRGNSTTRTLTVSSAPVSGGEGGGGGCSDTTWTCTDWGTCQDSSQNRTCTSNCGRTRSDKQNCTFNMIERVCVDVNSYKIRNCTSASGVACVSWTQFLTVLCDAGQVCQDGYCYNKCQDSCNPADYPKRNSNNVENCVLEEGCYKIVQKICDSNCVSEEEYWKSVENGIDRSNNLSTGTKTKTLTEELTVPVVVATGVTAVAVASSAVWLGWLWLLSLLVPFFLMRLRHYIVAIIDTGNKFHFVDEKGKVNAGRIEFFLETLKGKVGKLIFVGKKENTIRFLMEKGFLEIQLNAPVVINAHFSEKKSKDEFKKKFIETINLSVPKDKRDVQDHIIESVETSSAFALFRDWAAKRRSQREIDKLGG